MGNLISRPKIFKRKYNKLKTEEFQERFAYINHELRIQIDETVAPAKSVEKTEDAPTRNLYSRRPPTPRFTKRKKLKMPTPAPKGKLLN